MSRRRRLILRLVKILPLALFLSAAVLYVYVQTGRLAKNLDAVIVAEIRQRYDREARIGRVVASSPGHVTIYDAAISDGKTFASGTIVSAKRVQIRYRWVDAILGRISPLESVETVKVENPYISLLRDKKGRWNYSAFLKRRPGPPGKPFVGIVTVVDGQAVVRDMLSGPLAKRPAVNRILSINGQIDAAAHPVIRFAGAMAGDHVKRAQVAGRYNLVHKTLDIDASVQEADAAYWAVYKPVLGAFGILSGVLDAKITIGRTMEGSEVKWDYVGSADLRRVTLTIPKVSAPITGLSGRATFTNELATLQVKGVFERSPVNVRGAIVLEPKQSVRLAIESPRLDFATAVRGLTKSGELAAIKPEGVGPLRLLVVGPPKSLSVTVNARIPRATLLGYQASGVDVSLKYSGGIINISRASGSAIGGRITVAGVIDTTKPGYMLNLTGQAKSVRLQGIPPLRRATVSGLADAKFTVAGTTRRLESRISVQVKRGSLYNVAFNSANGTLHVSPGQFLVTDLTAAVAGGVVRLAGPVSSSTLDFQLNALDVDLDKLLRPLGFEGYSGKAYFRGRITGPFANPTVLGNAEVFDGGIGVVKFDYASGHVAGNKQAIALTDTNVKRYPSEATVSGRIFDIASPRRRYELEVDLKQAPAKDLVQTMGIALSVTGSVSGTASVTGVGGAPRVAGDFKLKDGSVAGYPVSAASGSIVYENGSVSLKDLSAKTDGSTVTASGSMSADKRIDAVFSAHNFALDDLNTRLQPFLRMAGTADISGTIRGSILGIQVDAGFSAAGIEVNGEKFDKMSANVSWDGDTMKLSGASLATGAETYQISQAAYNPKTTMTSAEGFVRGGQLARLLSIVKQSDYIGSPQAQKVRTVITSIPQPVQGEVTGAFSVNGKIAELQGSFTASGSGVSFGDKKVETAEIAISASKGEVKLDKFQAVSGDLNVTASGDILSHGNMNIEVEAYNLDVSLLQSYTGPLSLTGTATVIVVAKGPINSPEIQTSVEMVNPTFKGFKFDRIRASQIVFTKDRLKLTDVYFTRDVYRTRLDGSLPWNWDEFSVDMDRPIELRAELEKQPLALLTLFTSQLDPKGAEGTIDANLELKGTLNAPTVSGSLTIADGALNFIPLKTPPREGPSDFKHLQAKITFNQDTVNIESLKGDASKGGAFSVKGSISLADFPNGAVLIHAATDRLYLSEQNLTGIYNENVTARITSAVEVTGSLANPLVKGAAHVTDATINVSGKVSPSKGPMFSLPINPSFDLTVVAGKDVWVVNPRLRALVTGTATISGALDSVLARGTLVVQRGTIRLPIARLALRRGGRITFVYSAPEPVQTTLDLQAQTTAYGRTGLTGRKRYDVNLQLSGPIDNISIDARTNQPGMSRDQVIGLLGHVEGIFDSNEAAMKQEITDIFTTAIVPEVFSPLETAFAEALGLEEFRLELGAPGSQPVAVYFSKGLFGNLYGSYWQALSTVPGSDQYRLQLSYRMTDRLQLSVVTNERQEGIIEINGSARF